MLHPASKRRLSSAPDLTAESHDDDEAENRPPIDCERKKGPIRMAPYKVRVSESRKTASKKKDRDPEMVKGTSHMHHERSRSPTADEPCS
jgi:hypothetical protein